ncbi:RimJ/RimL family protein N-acetyltransferase [Hamadaea flava]|uniref:GNAT family N-acetyltransferase n=1 Tax=Hamadaea flava TaxID=1742688 RepID=A0ABV8LYP3_9ACTN|nr:GNAT family N-acetyltransferase [Hamadaea flava]MCP2324558.1 RimJ/RimL family protein N-acetyltransferase [Hamadaea flava]
MLRDATDSDRDIVLTWRNHPEVRKVSFTTHEIRPAEHAAWWAAVAKDSQRKVLIFEWRGKPAGVVSFDARNAAEEGVVWGFYLDNEGLGRDLLPAWVQLESDAVAYAFDVLQADLIGGETLAWNTPVLQLHKRMGFTETRRYEREVDGVPQEVVWTELSAADRTKGKRK